MFFQDLAGAVEGMFQPEIGRKRVMGSCGYDAVLDGIAFLQAEDAHRFDAHILVGGISFYRGIRCVADGAREDVGCAAIGVGDPHLGDFQLLKRAIVIEGQAGKLVRANGIVEFHNGVYFFARIAVRFKTNVRFQ